MRLEFYIKHLIINRNKANKPIMKLSLKSLLISSLILTVTLLFSINDTQAQQTSPPETEGKTVLEAVKTSDKTSDFAELLEQSGYAKVLNSQGPYTVLAPSNEAISKETEMSKLKEKPQKVKSIVQSHLYQGEVSSEQVESQMGVTIEEKDESPSNGVVYVVDQVVKPQKKKK